MIGNVNHKLEHKGVLFAVVRVTLPDDAPAFRWTIYQPSAVGIVSDVVAGPRAFARAYAAACVAIDAWLDGNVAPAGGNDAVDGAAGGD